MDSTKPINEFFFFFFFFFFFLSTQARRPSGMHVARNDKGDKVMGIAGSITILGEAQASRNVTMSARIERPRQGE